MSQRRCLFLVVALVGPGGCARAPRPTAVTPADIPALLAQAQQQPKNAAVRFRLAAALAAAQRCDTATVVARAALLLEPDNVLGPLVVGACQEQAGRYDAAVATYNDFVAQHPSARGVAALRGKAQLALRAQAEQTAQAALAHEADLAQQPALPATVAVLPLLVVGDSSAQPLSRGLAELITTDLAYVRTLRLLERLQIGVLLDELKLGQSARADPTTTARVGRLLRAERLVQGIASVPSQKTAPVQLSATVVTPSGVVRPVGQVRGPFRELLELEKQVVFNVAAQLGITLTDAERQRILRQGPKSLVAFLAYSRGLDALDRGDYQAAARNFAEAVRADPSFQAAQQGLQTSQAAPVVQSASGGQVVTVVQAVEQVTTPSEPATGSALNSVTQDVAPTLADVTTTGTNTTERQVAPESQGIATVTSASGSIHIVFRRPP